MSDNYLTEAFSQLRLQEQDFDMTSADIGRKDELKAFVADDIDEPVEEEIIDVEAEDDDDLQDSYIGKVITECNCCHSRYYEEKEDVTITEDGLANVDKECPVCHQSCGYTIIGEIQPYDANDYDVEITKKDKTEDEDELEEAYYGEGKIADKLKNTSKRWIKESLDDEEELEDERNIPADLPTRIRNTAYKFLENGDSNNKNKLKEAYDDDNKGGIANKLMKAARRWSHGGSSRFGESIQDATIETDEDIIKLSAKKKEGYDNEEMIAPIDNLDDFNYDDWVDEDGNFIGDENQGEEELPDTEGADFDINATEGEEETEAPENEEEPEEENEDNFKESLNRRRRRTNEEYAWIDTRDQEEETDDENNIQVDELDTDQYDELYEKVLNKNLKGDKEYKTTKVAEGKGKMVVEGCIKTDSGKKKKVKTTLRQKEDSDGNTVVLEGYSQVSPKLSMKLSIPCRIKESLMRPIEMSYKIASKAMNESRSNKRKIVKGIVR